MARIPKPKQKKVKHYPKRWCHLCLAEITDEMTKDAWVFKANRPCTIPGWESLAVAGVWDVSEGGLPVVWGITIAVACADCWPKADDYLAGIALLMEDEGAEEVPSVRSIKPLSMAEIEYVLDNVAEGKQSKVMVTTGHLVNPEDQEALDDWHVDTWDNIQEEAAAAKAAKSEGDG